MKKIPIRKIESCIFPVCRRRVIAPFITYWFIYFFSFSFSLMQGESNYESRE